MLADEEGEYDYEEYGEEDEEYDMESVDEIDAIKQRNKEHAAIYKMMGQTLARTYTESKGLREEAKARKLLFSRFAKNNNYKGIESIKKLLG